MKTLDYGDKSGLKVVDNEITVSDNNSMELLEENDVLSARTLNRPLSNLYENQGESYKLIQSLLKSVYGNFVGIVPNVYEGLSPERFKIGEILGNKFIRIPTGLLYLRKPIKDDHSYYIPGERQYQDDLSPELLREDGSYSVIFQPNICMFERQLAYLIGMDLNDQSNDIKVGCQFENGTPRYSIKITDNSGETVELPKNYWGYNEENVKVKLERDIDYRDNSIDLFNDFFEYYSDYIELSPNEIHNLICLDTVIPLGSSLLTNTPYYVYYKITGKEESTSSHIDQTGKLYLSIGSGDDDSVKLFTLRFGIGHNEIFTLIDEMSEGENPSQNGWYEYDEEKDEYVASTDTEIGEKKYYEKTIEEFDTVSVVPDVDTLDQRLIATKRAELDTLLVRRRSEIGGDVFIKNENVGLTLTKDEFYLRNNDSKIEMEKDSVSIASKEISNKAESILNDADRLEIKNALIELINTKGLNVKDKNGNGLLSAAVDGNGIDMQFLEKELLKVNEREITTYKSIAPFKDRTLSLGTPQRRFLKIYGDIYGNTSTASILYNSDNLIITNMDLTETRRIGHDVGKKVLSDNSVVYHFDQDYLDNHGNDDLTLNGEYELGAAIDEESLTPDDPVYPFEPYQEDGKHLIGDFSVTRDLKTEEGHFSIDFWYKYNFNSRLFKIEGSSESFEVKNHSAEVPFYKDVAYESDFEYDEYDTNKSWPHHDFDESDGGEIVATIPFYKPSEYLEKYIEEGYIDEDYVESDYAKLEEDDEGNWVIKPKVFIKEDDSNNTIIAVVNNIETTLEENEVPVQFAKDDWLHICVTFDNDKIRLYIDKHRFEFNRNGSNLDFSLEILGSALDELMVDESVVETYEQFSFFNENGNRLNWGTLDFQENNFIIDVKELPKVYTNLFESEAFANAVRNVVNNMQG